MGANVKMGQIPKHVSKLKKISLKLIETKLNSEKNLLKTSYLSSSKMICF